MGKEDSSPVEVGRDSDCGTYVFGFIRDIVNGFVEQVKRVVTFVRFRPKIAPASYLLMTADRTGRPVHTQPAIYTAPPTVAPVGPVYPPGPDFWSTVPDSVSGQLGFYTFGPIGASEITFYFDSMLVGFDIEYATDLVALHFPYLVSLDPTSIQSGVLLFLRHNPGLTTIELPVFLPTQGMTLDFQDNALTAATVNAVLARLVANPAFTSGTVHLEGAGNAAPTGQGLTDKATLLGRGVALTTS